MLLSELQKRTEGTEHHEQIKEVGVVVREIALTINEEKRKQEEVRALSEKFDGWNGPPLTVYSSMLYCQVRILNSDMPPVPSCLPRYTFSDSAVV